MKLSLRRAARAGALAFALGATSLVQAAGWFTTWAGPGRDPGATASTFPAGTTIREPVFATIAGDSVRVKFSNAFGAQPLTIGPASIGVRASDSSVVPGTLMPLTFGGNASVDVPVRGAVLSDPVSLNVPALTDLVVSIYLPNGSGESVSYPSAMKTTYIGTGDQTGSTTFTQTSTSTSSGFFVASVEVHSSTVVGVIAAVGDSITQGVGSSGENNRWSDRLAFRISGGAAPLGVMGLGIAGNRMLSGALTNPAALARFDRDVLGMAGLTHIIMADGINDLGSTAANPALPPNADDVEYGLRQLVARAHARGVKVIGTTMGPAFGFNNYQNVDFKRNAYNAWIRTTGLTILDGLIDFDAVLNDPANPGHMLAQYLTDGIHPNNPGHQAMANAVDLSLFH